MGKTIQGNAVANANAARRVNRSTAERALSEFLDRVRGVNADDEYLFQVDGVVVFGSYLDDNVDRLSDVDVAVELSRRHPEEEFRDRSKARVSAAQDAGRRFSTTFELVTWPKQEVLLQLKAGSRVISMIEGRSGLPRGADREVVYRRQG